MSNVIKDAKAAHWVYRLPQPARSFAQLSRLDRPIGYWLLALPGWIGLAFASLSHGFAAADLKWAALILIGAIAMRGAGCTYNDIVDQDLDAKVERTALRPLPAGTISTKQAWLWLLAQCAVGLIVLLCMPRLAQIISLCAIPLVAAYPFMKRITWWPQVWLGMTFNWAVLVAYAAKVEHFEPGAYVLYVALVFWTVGYDTIYACQDIEDDAIIGVKSTARRFGRRIKWGVSLCYIALFSLITLCLVINGYRIPLTEYQKTRTYLFAPNYYSFPTHIPLLALLPFGGHLLWQIKTFVPKDGPKALRIFKSNFFAAIILILTFLVLAVLSHTAIWVPEDEKIFLTTP